MCRWTADATAYVSTNTLYDLAWLFQNMDDGGLTSMLPLIPNKADSPPLLPPGVSLRL